MFPFYTIPNIAEELGDFCHGSTDENERKTTRYPLTIIVPRQDDFIIPIVKRHGVSIRTIEVLLECTNILSLIFHIRDKVSYIVNFVCHEIDSRKQIEENHGFS